MTTLLFRTESTDLFRGRRPLNDPTMPRMMKIEAVLLHRKTLRIVNEMSVLIQPNGWVPNAGASASHGITVRECELYGVRPKAALVTFMDMVRSASEICAWGLPFHRGIIDVELNRADAQPDEWMRAGLKRTCLMVEAGAKWNNGRAMTLMAAADNTFEGQEGTKMAMTLNVFRTLRNGG